MKLLALTIDERAVILDALDDPPDGLAELRGVLMNEHEWRQREGLDSLRRLADGRRLVMLNIARLTRAPVEAARSLIGDDEPRGPALVVAQAAVEVGLETAIDFALRIRRTFDPLREWVTSSPSAPGPEQPQRARAVTALTGDKITQASSWKAYKEGLKWRDDFVHRASACRANRPRLSSTPRQLVAHVVQASTETPASRPRRPEAEARRTAALSRTLPHQDQR